MSADTKWDLFPADGLYENDDWRTDHSCSLLKTCCRYFTSKSGKGKPTGWFKPRPLPPSHTLPSPHKYSPGSERFDASFC